MLLPKPLRGIVPPIVTPLAAPDALDVPGLERLLERIVAAGCQGIFVLGSTGEAQSLSYSLRLEMVRQTCAIVNRRLPVLAGISDTSVVEAARFGEACAAAGACALVTATPYYFPLSQCDLLRYAGQLASELPTPLFLYNIPSLTKLAWAPETIARASEIPGIAGVKDSSGDLVYLQRVLRLLAGKPDFSVLIGPEELLAQALLLGAHGGVCGGANLRPELYVDLWSAVNERCHERIASIASSIMDLSEALYHVGAPETSYFRGIKYALEADGVCSGLPAPPLAPFNEAEKAVIRKWLSTANDARYYDGCPPNIEASR